LKAVTILFFPTDVANCVLKVQSSIYRRRRRIVIKLSQCIPPFHVVDVWVTMRPGHAVNDGWMDGSLRQATAYRHVSFLSFDVYDTVPPPKIESSPVWDTSCLAEQIYGLINSQFLCGKCSKVVMIQYLNHHRNVAAVKRNINYSVNEGLHLHQMLQHSFRQRRPSRSATARQE